MNAPFPSPQWLIEFDLTELTLDIKCKYIASYFNTMKLESGVLFSMRSSLGRLLGSPLTDKTWGLTIALIIFKILRANKEMRSLLELLPDLEFGKNFLWVFFCFGAWLFCSTSSREIYNLFPPFERPFISLIDWIFQADNRISPSPNKKPGYRSSLRFRMPKLLWLRHARSLLIFSSFQYSRYVLSVVPCFFFYIPFQVSWNLACWSCQQLHPKAVKHWGFLVISRTTRFTRKAKNFIFIHWLLVMSAVRCQSGNLYSSESSIKQCYNGMHK